MEQIINSLREFGSENGLGIALFIINFAKDLSLFFEPMIWFFQIIGFVLFISLGFDFKNRAAREAAGQKITTGGMIAKTFAVVCLAQLTLFVDALTHSMAGEDVSAMRPYGYVEQMVGSEANTWGDMLLGVMVILTLMAWFYLGKALIMFAKLDSAQDREARLNGSIITAIGASMLLIIVDIAKAFAASGGLQIESGGGII